MIGTVLVESHDVDEGDAKIIPMGQYFAQALALAVFDLSAFKVNVEPLVYQLQWAEIVTIQLEMPLSLVVVVAAGQRLQNEWQSDFANHTRMIRSLSKLLAEIATLIETNAV